MINDTTSYFSYLHGKGLLLVEQLQGTKEKEKKNSFFTVSSYVNSIMLNIISCCW